MLDFFGLLNTISGCFICTFSGLSNILIGLDLVGWVRFVFVFDLQLTVVVDLLDGFVK